MSDDDLFRQAMAGVAPIKKSNKVTLNRSSQTDFAKQAKRKAAVAETAADKNTLTAGEVELLDAFCPLEFRRAGVQNGVFRKLKQGKYQPDARLDLHRMTVERARHEVFDFIQQSAAYDLRVVVIVHGKGTHSGSEQALLKSYVNKWLPELEPVQAFCSARPQHGGVGAVYVQLKKSERLKQQNRDHFRRGRSE
jgi:DNA-nicking Smr family endonuclease